MGSEGCRIGGESDAAVAGRRERGQYAVDFAQRSILFWDTLRQRGNNFLEHERNGLPPVLHFDYETIMDGRSLKRRSTTRCCESCRRRA